MAETLTLEGMRHEIMALGHTAMSQDKPAGYVVMALAVAVAPISLFYNPKVGAYLTVAALALLLGMAARDEIKRRLLLSAATVPLLGMINMSFSHESAFGQTAILYASMLILSLVYRRIWLSESVVAPLPAAKVRNRNLVIPGAVLASILIGLLAARLISTGYVFGGVPVWQIFVTALVGACAEESLFRGLIQRQAAQLLRARYAIGLTSLLYLPLCFNHFSGWSLLIGGLSTALLSIVYAVKPNLILTTSLNLASKLAYLAVTAAFIFR